MRGHNPILSIKALIIAGSIAGALAGSACNSSDEDAGAPPIGPAGSGGSVSAADPSSPQVGGAGGAGGTTSTSSSGASGGGGNGGSAALPAAGTSAAGAGAAGTSGAGGNGESGASGAGSSGQAPGDAGSGPGSPGMSAGCGKDDSLKSGRASIDVSGTHREYVLKVPDDYDAGHAYRLIFGWHWKGGSANDVVSGTVGGGPYYGLETLAEGSAIFVAPQGIDAGFANTDGRDIAFLRAMLQQFEAGLCIDTRRIFSTGFSYGGMMSDSIGCEMADVVRAIAPMSGGTPIEGHAYSGCKEANDHPIAVWMAHGTSDTVVPISAAKQALELFAKRNGCQTTTSPATPSPCVAYEGCMADYPIHWCEFSGGHMTASFAAKAIWDFFSKL